MTKILYSSATRMVFLFIIIAMGISLSYSVEAIRVNEIMYDPSTEQGNDNYNEWIEIYNDENGEINLENYTMCGKAILEGYVDNATGSIYEETGLILGSGEYALITDGGTGTLVYVNFDVDEDALDLHVDASSLCGGQLSNSGDTITIEKNNISEEEVTYADDAEPGYSLEFINSEFIQSAALGGTPGSENSVGNTQNNSQNNQNQSNNQNENNNSENQEVNDLSDNSLNSNNASLVNINNPAPGTANGANSQNKKEKIVLNSPSPAEKNPEKKESSFISSQENIRTFVIYAFLIFTVILIILLALKKL